MQYSTKLLGIQTVDDWKHFAWEVTINGISFEYKTGMGHVKNKRASNRTIPDSELIPAEPELDMVLENLFMDSQASEISFDDWCNNFDYDTDSRKALEMYLGCQENDKKLKQALKDEYYEEKRRIENKY